MPMKTLLPFTALVILLTLFAPRVPSTGAKHAVLVELFTSEGCSSCPPADELLGRLRQQNAANGVEVIPLGFHVDYWDFQGWRDRFSSAAYTRRQQQYAQKFRLDGPYTPQMVVNGEEEFVGSSAGRAHQSISQAAARPPGVEIAISSMGPDKLLVHVRGGAQGDVLLAITEDNLSTSVDGGENGGRTLRHSAVVRDFRRVGQLRDGSFEAGVPLKINKEWKRSDLRAVAFVQDVDSGKMLAASSLQPF